MTEQPQSKIDTAISELMDVPSAARDAVLTLAGQLAEMTAEERAELERGYRLIKRYAPNKIIKRDSAAQAQKRKRGPKPVTAAA